VVGSPAPVSSSRTSLFRATLLALILNGVLSGVFGLLLVVVPALGMLTLVWIIGGYAIVFGVVMLILALRLRARHLRTALGTTR